MYIDIVRRSAFGIVCGAIGAFIVSSGEVIHNLRETCEWIRLCKSETLDLAENTSKGVFSDGLTKAAMDRVVRARIFHTANKYRSAASDVNANWRAYVDSVARWSSELPIFYTGIERWYPRKAEQLQGIIGLFIGLDSDIGQLRRSSFGRMLADGKITEPSSDESQLIDRVGGDIETLNMLVFLFSSCLDPKVSTKVQNCDDFIKSLLKLAQYQPPPPSQPATQN